jgi:hypothetical protein
MRVLCVDASFVGRPNVDKFDMLPQQGETYSVRQYIPGFYLPGFRRPQDGIWLNEIVGRNFEGTDVECGFAAFHFCPLEDVSDHADRLVEDEYPEDLGVASCPSSPKEAEGILVPSPLRR